MSERHIHVGAEICAAIGVDPKMTVAIDLHFGVNDVATVTVERHLSRDEAADVAAVLRYYNIVPVPDVEPPLSLADQAVQKIAGAATP